MIWQSACRFAEKVQGQEGYVAPDAYNDEFGRESLKPGDYSDIGQAKGADQGVRVELRYTAATDYLRFCGQYWVESKQQAVGAAEEFSTSSLRTRRMRSPGRNRRSWTPVFQRMPSPPAASRWKRRSAAGRWTPTLRICPPSYKAFVMKRRDMKYVVSLCRRRKPMLEISVSDLDKDGFLLNTPDGTYYLPDGLEGKRDHSPEDYITKITAAAPGGKGEKLWLDSLDTIFCGDSELIDYVQQIVGMAAVGRVYMESLVIAYGEGRNGKVHLLEHHSPCAWHLQREYVRRHPHGGCKRNVKPELAEAKGKRLIIAAELEEGMRLNTSVVKQMCSTDEIFAEKKYKDPFPLRRATPSCFIPTTCQGWERMTRDVAALNRDPVPCQDRGRRGCEELCRFPRVGGSAGGHGVDH